MRSFYFQKYFNNAQTNEQRVKNAHAGTLINKNVIIPPQPPNPTPPPHPTPPHPPTPSHPPEQTLACQRATGYQRQHMRSKERTRVKPSLAKVNSVSRTHMQER